jgi:hypothetical protein
VRTLAPAIAVLVALAVGCGDDEGDSSGLSTPSGKGSALELTLDPDGADGEEPQVKTVECPDPPRLGPDPLCGHVLILSPQDLEPVPPQVACPEIYGGPDILRIQGTLEGKAVDATLTRENGCEIDRFDTWSPILHDLFPSYRPGASLAPS